MNRLVFLFALLVSLPAAEMAFTQGLLHTFNDPTPGAFDNFGNSVAIAGNKVLIGSPLDDTNGENVGQALLFDAATGTLLQTFNDPTPASGDRFGRSVAIHGDNVLIGAPLDSTNGFEVGQAHLFDATTGSLLQTFNDLTPATDDRFGGSVAIHGDNVLIGARFDNTTGRFVGQAHLFDATTGTLLRTFNDPTPSSKDSFGGSVAIHGDNVLIGAPFDDTTGRSVGQAHLFDATTGSLLQTFNAPTPTLSGSFGGSVAIHGNNVLIGAQDDDTNGFNVGQAHLFDATTGSLLQTFNDPTPTSQDLFGISVAIHSDSVLIGAAFHATTGLHVGQAHLFDAATGSLLQTFNDPTPSPGDRFGGSVAIHGDNVLIGAQSDDTNGPDVGQAHLFDITVPEPASGLLLGNMSLIWSVRRRRSV